MNFQIKNLNYLKNQIQNKKNKNKMKYKMMTFLIMMSRWVNKDLDHFVKYQLKKAIIVRVIVNNLKKKAQKKMKKMII